MSGLFRPGESLAAGVFDDAGLLEALAAVETAWLQVLAADGPAPDDAVVELGPFVGAADAAQLGRAAESSGNAVVPLLALVRERLRGDGLDAAAHWLHRGLTSQDTLDTALVLLLRDTRNQVRTPLREVVTTLVDLAERHGADPATGRTLTQPAVPVRFGARVAAWLRGVLSAVDDLDRLVLPAQVGGAAGTLSGVAALVGADAAPALATHLAERLGLAPSPPWHTDRAPVTRAGEALTRVTAALGHVANDVLTGSRPELGELAEGSGGGSSTMPHKSNPVRATLVRRAALAAPALLAQLHLAAADTGDERPAGAWHLEWEPLRDLARQTVSATVQTRDLLADLKVDTARMAANLAAADGVDAERASLAALLDRPRPDAWAGADDALVGDAVARARTWLATPA